MMYAYCWTLRRCSVNDNSEDDYDRIVKNFESYIAERVLFSWQEDPGPSPSSAMMSCMTSSNSYPLWAV